MMKKLFVLLTLTCVLGSLSAQKVNETVTLFGKDQLTGFTTNIAQTPSDIVEHALADKLEKNYAMKGSKKKGYYVYMNQPCAAFGEARYDVYFTAAEVGKKKNKATQVTLVVSTGNQNCITFANDPRTSRNIVAFLEAFPNDVEAYKITLRINALKDEIASLEKERSNLEKDQEKAKQKATKMNEDMQLNVAQVEAKTAEIAKLQENYNQTHNESIKDQISAAAKEKQNLQKSQSSMQKSLLKLNDELHKNDVKLEENLKNLEKKRAELQQIQR